MNERRQRFFADRACNVPARIDRVDDDKRFGKRFGGGTLERDHELVRPPTRRRLENTAEGFELEHEELAEVPGESLYLRLRAVYAYPLAERLQEPDLVALALSDPVDHVPRVKRRPIDRAHLLGGVADPVARDDFDLESLPKSARVRVLRVHPLLVLEELPEGEAHPLERLPRRLPREEDEDVDLRLREVRALRDAAHEERFRGNLVGLHRQRDA